MKRNTLIKCIAIYLTILVGLIPLALASVLSDVYNTRQLTLEEKGVGKVTSDPPSVVFSWAKNAVSSAFKKSGSDAFKSPGAMMESKTGSLGGGRAIDSFTKNPDFLKSAKQLKSEGIVTVDSFKEANALRQYTFPNAQKVPGAGPKTGKASESVFERSDNVYKTDYLKDPTTGRIYGEGTESAHAYSPHINIKYNKQEYVILIDDLTKTRR